uniref:WW domain-containing protein n=1 Tax=Panagrellus redivivus TaxID=6233 RepID=A0A7E4W6T4_PANRE
MYSITIKQSLQDAHSLILQRFHSSISTTAHSSLPPSSFIAIPSSLRAAHPPSEPSASPSSSYNAVIIPQNIASPPPPLITSREKLKRPQIYSNYFNSDPDTCFFDMALKSTPPIANSNTRSNMTLSNFMPSGVAAATAERKNSVDSLASNFSGCKLSPSAEEAANKADNSGSENNSTPSGKRRGKKAARQRVKKVSVNFTIVGSENKESQRPAMAAEKQAANLPAALTTQANSANLANKERKEDYWYYDQISDGFYYENNGSRGWRKRNEKIHGPPPSAKKPAEAEQKVQGAPGAAGAPGKPTPASGIKYDPASDGYFFEMASVDGWRRRQPDKPVVAGFPPKSNSAANFPPLNSAMSTPPPPPPTAPQMQSSQFASGSNNQITNAQLEEMIVRQHLSGAPRRLGSLFNGQPQQPQQQHPMAQTRMCLPSNASTTSSLSEDATSPPPQGTTEQQSMFMSRFRRQGGLQPSHSTSNCLTNSVNFRVGSADENYEFYWSDTEKASSISSVDDMSSEAMKESSIPRDAGVIGQIGDFRRPDSLNVSRPNTSAWWDAKFISDDRTTKAFDVDKFINDLPSFDDDKMYRAMMSESSPRTLRPPTSTGPEVSNTPLCTPLKNDHHSSWWAAPNPSSHNPLDAFAQKDIKKIWQQSVAS